jgi:hypothetical protein
MTQALYGHMNKKKKKKKRSSPVETCQAALFNYSLLKCVLDLEERKSKVKNVIKVCFIVPSDGRKHPKICLMNYFNMRAFSPFYFSAEFNFLLISIYTFIVSICAFNN